MSAIMMSQIAGKDPVKFQDYLTKSKAVAGRYGAELMFAGQRKDALDDAPPDHQMVVIARFPDEDALKDWYEDTEYTALIPLREEASDQIITVYAD
ncbi:DUF1330 domain-containing protein [Roseovarius phycicola]|uniref:DUF1330 domain-containing protein n=1 Tax=Roseovarius phycicola TaxID=3080976 RepID=A0ABZ2HGQ8_9RHOB